MIWKNFPYPLRGMIIFAVFFLIVNFVPQASFFLMLPYFLISMPLYFFLWALSSITNIQPNDSYFIHEGLLFFYFLIIGAVAGLIYGKLKRRRIKIENENRTTWFRKFPIWFRVLIITWIISIILILPVFALWSCVGLTCLGVGIYMMPSLILSMPVLGLFSLVIKDFSLESNPPMIMFFAFIQFLYFTVVGLILGVIIQKYKERKLNNSKQ